MISLGMNVLESPAPVVDILGCQTPRLFNYPTIYPTYFTSLADDGMDLAALCGYELLPWQEDLIRRSLIKRDSGRWSARNVLNIITRQGGKCLAWDTELLTANRGWSSMGDVRVGDFVFGPDGREREVTYVSELKFGLDCYRVSFTDGRSIVTDADHLWTVVDTRAERSRAGDDGRRVRWHESRDMTTRQMFEAELSRCKSGGRTSTLDGVVYETNEYRFQLPAQLAISDLAKVDLPVDPYLLGAWLGDGSSAHACLSSHADDVPHWVAAISEAGFIPTVRDGRTCKTIGITTERGVGRQSRSFSSKLRDLGVLGNKHIPDVFLLAGDVQREALLQGLMDSDGHAAKRATGRVEFSSTNKGLADGVAFLARSLGWRVRVSTGTARLYGKDCGPKYRVTFTAKALDAFSPFRMKRKADRIGAGSGRPGRNTVSVCSIDEVSTVPVRCIRVADEDGLFLAGRELIPTHNTVCLEVRELIGLILLNERIFHTSQQAKTNSQAWLSLRNKIFAVPDLAELMEKPKNGGEEVSIRRKKLKRGDPGGNEGDEGGFVRYIARSPDSGRGFTAIDLIMLDEAYALSDAELGALLPTQSASRNPQTWYTSSAGTEDSSVLSRVRDQGVSGTSDSLLFTEWSLPEGADPADRSLWPIAKPSLGADFCSVENLESDFMTMDFAEFAREHMGMWDDPRINSVIPLDAWKACELPDGPGGVPPDVDVSWTVAALDVDPGRRWASVVLAGRKPDGGSHVEVIAREDGVAWVMPMMRKLFGSSKPPRAVGVQAGAAAGSFMAELEQVGFKVVPLSPQHVAAATAMFYDDIMQRNLSHLDDPSLVEGLVGAGKYSIGRVDSGGWGWLRRDTNVDITGIAGCSYANYLLRLEDAEEASAPKKKRYRMAHRPGL